MKIVDYDSIKKFKDDWEEILYEDEIRNQLILINIPSLVEKQNDSAIFGVAFKNNELAMIYLQAPPRNMILTTYQEISESEIEQFAVHVHSLGKEFIGMNACGDFVFKFMEVYSKLSGKEFEVTHPMDILKITQLVDVVLPEGIFRRVTLNDIDIIDDWVDCFNLEAVNETSDKELIHKANLRRIETGNFYLYEYKKGEIVSMGQLSRFMRHGVAMNLIYTKPEQRGYGYGLAISYHLVKTAFEMGQDYVTLFVDKQNPVSNHVYRKIGFKTVTDNYDLRLK